MKFVLAMKLLFLAKRGVLERAIPGGKSATVAAMQHASLMQQLQIFTNGDLRCVIEFGQVGHQDPAFTVYSFDNGASALFI